MADRVSNMNAKMTSAETYQTYLTEKERVIAKQSSSDGLTANDDI